MASDIGFVEYVCGQLEGAGAISYKKMFGEYLIYCDGRPVVLICDDTAYVKINETTTALLGEAAARGCPYGGAKPHYLLEELDDRQALTQLVRELVRVTPLPKARKKK